jgi:hypothetical protein
MEHRLKTVVCQGTYFIDIASHNVRACSRLMIKWHTASCDSKPLGNTICFELYAGVLNFLHYCLFHIAFGTVWNYDAKQQLSLIIVAVYSCALACILVKGVKELLQISNNYSL